jgi:hypothetical protein
VRYKTLKVASLDSFTQIVFSHTRCPHLMLAQGHKGFLKTIIGFKAFTEENLIRKKEQNMFYCTRNTQQFHMGYTTFNRSQYGHHLSSCKCLVCIQLRSIHDKASLAWLFQQLRRFCPSGVADLLFFRRTQCSWCTPTRESQEQLNPGFWEAKG